MAKFEDIIETQQEGEKIAEGDVFKFDRVKFKTISYSGDNIQAVVFYNSTSKAEPKTTTSAVIISQVKTVLEKHAVETTIGDETIYVMDDLYNAEVLGDKGKYGRYLYLK